MPVKSNHYGLHSHCFRDWFNMQSLEKFVSLQAHVGKNSADTTDCSTSQNISFYHGKFKKYSANLEKQTYILKMRQEYAPEIPEVEYLCNQIGSLLHIPVAPFYLIYFNEERTFVTKNFIKPGDPTNLQHIYHFRPDAEHSCEGLIKTIIEHSDNPCDIQIFLNTILFDALIGNHDRHGRNLAFVVTSKHTTLAPIYDNVSYLSLEQDNMLKADFNPTGKIRTKASNEPSMRDYAIELNRLGYKKELVDFYNTIDLLKIESFIDKSFCSSLMKIAIKNLITKRFKELHDGLFH